MKKYNSKLHKYINKLELDASNLCIAIARLGKIILLIEGVPVLKTDKKKKRKC